MEEEKIFESKEIQKKLGEEAINYQNSRPMWAESPKEVPLLCPALRKLKEIIIKEFRKYKK